MGKVYLKNAGVNSGTAVWLLTNNIKVGWKILTRATPAESKEDIVEAERGGFENPTILVEGTIDVDSVPSNSITYALLKDFAEEVSNSTYLQIPVGTTPTYIDGHDEDPDSETNWIRVQFISFNVIIDANSELGHFMRYTINLRETK